MKRRPCLLGQLIRVLLLLQFSLPVWGARAGAIIGLLLFVLLGSLVAWNLRHVKPLQFTAVEAELRRARRKHKDVIADVADVPSYRHLEGIVVPVESLEELIKIADALLKPVLHKRGADRHSYWVVDGTTRYQYVSVEQHPEEA